jgi:photosystem II stability/assembly factor-like uncharacterized protein
MMELGLKLLVGMALVISLSAVLRAQNWERLGPEGGMVVSLAADGENRVYLGTADGHVFASVDGAKSWELRGRVGSRLDAVVTRIVADPRDGNRIFAAVWYQQTGAGGGVFESEDRGKSWKLLGLGGEAVRTLEMAPSRSYELVAGTRTGVFLSVDTGKSWARISPEGDDELRNLDSLAIDPRDPQVIYAGTFHLPWLTRDGGKSWKPVLAGIIDDSDIMSLRLDASNPERVFMSACSGIYRSENQGAEWIKLQGVPYAARRTQVIVQDPANPKTLYAGTTAGLWITHDGGESWVLSTSKDWVISSLAVLAAKNGQPGRLVVGTEAQGVLVSEDAGANFVEANHGFTHVIVKQLVSDERYPGNLLLFVERSGLEIRESHDGGKSWSSLPLSAVQKGSPSTLNTNQVQEIYASPWGWLLRLENAQLWKWEEGAKTWREWRLRLPATPGKNDVVRKAQAARSPSPQLLAPSTVVFSQKDALVSTKEGLLRCQESGNCQRLKPFGSREMIRAVWVSQSGNQISVVTDADLGWSSDGGVSTKWRDLPVASEKVLWLDAAESDSQQTAYLGTSEGIFFSVGDGPWQRIEGGLPAGQVDRWLRGSGIWAVSEREGTLYISEDAGKTWKRADQDAERGRFTGLAVTQDGEILAGSQSEGLLRIRLEKPKEQTDSDGRHSSYFHGIPTGNKNESTR